MEITILPQAPVISSAATANGTVGSAFSHQITASNSPSSYSVSGALPAGLSLNATSGLISGTPSAVGNATVTISATNAGGSGNQFLTLRILPQAPVITSALTASGTVGSVMSYQITASNSPSSYSVEGTLPAGLSLNATSGLINGTPNSAGNATVTINAANAGGSGSQSLTLRILNQAPLITSAPTASGTVGSVISYQITASNSPSSYSVTGNLPSGLSLNATSGLISGTPSSAGNATVTISAANAGGSGNQALTFRILPQAPVISNAATANGTVGSAFSYQIAASNSPASYSIEGALPDGLSLNPTSGLISGTPSAAGNATVMVSATNAGGSGNQSLTLRILALAPAITSAVTANGMVDSAFSYQITASNSPTSFSVSGTLPAGLSLNATSGLISGTPSAAGNTFVTVSASNTEGSGNQALTLRILALDPAITSAVTANGMVDSAFSYQITASNSPTSFSVSGTLPAGLSLNATSGLISGTPSAAGNATVTINAANAGGMGNSALTIRILQNGQTSQSPVVSSIPAVSPAPQNIGRLTSSKKSKGSSAKKSKGSAKKSKGNFVKKSKKRSF